MHSKQVIGQFLVNGAKCELSIGSEDISWSSVKSRKKKRERSEKNEAKLVNTLDFNHVIGIRCLPSTSKGKHEPVVSNKCHSDANQTESELSPQKNQRELQSDQDIVKIKVYYGKEAQNKSSSRLLKLKKLTIENIREKPKHNKSNKRCGSHKSSPETSNGSINHNVCQTNEASELRSQPSGDRSSYSSNEDTYSHLSTSSKATSSENPIRSNSTATNESLHLCPNHGLCTTNKPQPPASSINKPLDELAKSIESQLRIKRTIQSRPKRLLIFVNPYGGKGKAIKVYKSRVSRLMELAEIEVKLIVTKYANHAKDTLEDPQFNVEYFDGVICIGGDGMFSELMNGMLFRYNRQLILSAKLAQLNGQRSAYETIAKRSSNNKSSSLSSASTSLSSFAESRDIRRHNVNKHCNSLSESEDSKIELDDSSQTDASLSANSDAICIRDNDILEPLQYSRSSHLADNELMQHKMGGLVDSDLLNNNNNDSYTSNENLPPANKHLGVDGKITNGLVDKSDLRAECQDSEVTAYKKGLGGIGKQFSSPPIPIGVIGAGSTDANSFGLVGTNDVITATLNIILGNQIDIDICSIHSIQEDRLLRFVSTFVAYGYFGDVVRESEKLRWLGPKRYDVTGVNNLIRNRVYKGMVRILLSSEDGSPMDSQRCHNNCEECKSLKKGYIGEELRLVEQSGPFVGVNAAVTACRCPQTKKGFSPNNHLANGCADLILVRPCTRVQYVQYLLRTGWTKKSAFDLKYVDAYRCRQFEFHVEPADKSTDANYKSSSPTGSQTSTISDDRSTSNFKSSNSISLESHKENNNKYPRFGSTLSSNFSAGSSLGSGKSRASEGFLSSWNVDGEVLNEQSIRVKVNNQLLRVFGTGEPKL